MVLAQNGGYFLDSLFRIVFRDGRGEYSLNVGDGQQTFLYSGIGGDNHIILVLSHGVISFGSQYPDDAEGGFVEPDGLSQWFFSLRE